MCGIIGLNWEDTSIKKGVEEIKHRGPDDSGTFVKNGISLGSVRLSIQDLSSKGHMPMVSENGNYVITFNGEIYNFKEVKEKLKGYKFKSGTDTEVILNAYDKWGPKCLEKFNGMFAFCIYDKKKKEFFIARDRFGIKPLYYFDSNKKLGFCSEIKGLLDYENQGVDAIGMRQFFTFRFTLGDRTLVNGIKKFLPGHYMIYDLAKKKVKKYEQYYSLEKQDKSKLSYSELKKEVKEKIEKSVERRMVSDVPVAALLSGGIDSSIITALAKKHNKDLNTFSIGFDTTDESSYAKIVADKFETNHHEIKVTKDNLLDHLDDMVYHMDEPIGDPAFLPILVLSKEVKKKNKVVLSGDGADEIFVGYDRYKMLHHGSYLKKFALFTLNNPVLKRLKAMRGKKDFEEFFEIIKLFEEWELKALKVEKYDGAGFWKGLYKEKVANAQQFDIETLLPNDFFMKADKMSSAYGLEQRVPFMDHELVELAFSIPQKYKLKGWKEKHILKDAFSDVLPKEITERKKFAFHVPIDYWFKNVLGDKLKELLDSSDHGLYDKQYVYHLLEQVKESGDNYKYNFFLAQKLWSILVFEMWYEEFMS